MSFTSALVYFGLITVAMLFVEIMFTYATQGFAFGLSSDRGASTEYSKLALRIKRAYQNQIESAAYAVPVLVAAAVLGLKDSNAELAALVLVSGRALFAVLYYSGIPLVRLIGFGMGTLSTLYIVYALMSSGLV